MAQQESDRENLLREATALVERAELAVKGESEPVVVGFRRDGAASFFFGVDPVYQFNSARELRRAYVGGLLYKAEKGRLAALRRERQADATYLIRTDLGDDDTAAFLSAMNQRLHLLMGAIDARRFTVIGQIPPDGNIPQRIAAWFHAAPAPFRIAASPGVK